MSLVFDPEIAIHYVILQVSDGCFSHMETTWPNVPLLTFIVICWVLTCLYCFPLCCPEFKQKVLAGQKGLFGYRHELSIVLFQNRHDRLGKSLQKLRKVSGAWNHDDVQSRRCRADETEGSGEFQVFPVLSLLSASSFFKNRTRRACLFHPRFKA